MRVLINRQPVDGPWGGGNLWVRAFFDYAKEFDVQLGTKLNQPYDAILMVDPRPDELGIGLSEVQRYRLFKPGVKVFQRVNECDARKQTTDMDPMLRSASTINDHTFFVSDWMSAYHTARNWACGSTSVVYNGVDRGVFKPNVKLGNGKVNIVTHHWSSNKLKGEDVHLWLDNFVKENPGFTYTYIGRIDVPLPNSKILAPLWGQELGQELGKYDVYISGSRFDPGPNSILEAISCGLPTFVHPFGGGCVEFAGNDHVYKNAEDLKSILLRKAFTPNQMKIDDYRLCIQQYILKMQEILGKL